MSITFKFRCFEENVTFGIDQVVEASEDSFIRLGIPTFIELCV